MINFLHLTITILRTALYIPKYNKFQSLYYLPSLKGTLLIISYLQIIKNYKQLL